MRVNVIHLLPAPWPRINYRPETRFATGVGHAQLAGETRGQGQHSTKQRRIGLGTARKRLDVLAWNHQHMDRRGRIDVMKSHEFIVFMDLLARNFSRSDLAK